MVINTNTFSENGVAENHKFAKKTRIISHLNSEKQVSWGEW